MILTFGKYKGTHILNVPDEYLLWLSGQDIRDVVLRKYLDDNLEAIKANVKRNERLHSGFKKIF